MNSLDIWNKVRKKMKTGVRKKFVEIRKLIGYKNEESLAVVLGVTRQTLSKFSKYSEIEMDNTHNMLLLSVIALMDNFLYENRFDYDNINNYIQELDKCFFSEICADDELQGEIKSINPLYFFMENTVEGRYINLWLDTFKNEKLISDKAYTDINYSEPTICQIVNNYHIYMVSDFLLENKASNFLEELFYMLIKKGRKIKISNYTIDSIQQSRLSCEGNVHENSVNALKTIQKFEKKKVIKRIDSNSRIEGEIALIKSEICKLDKKNVIVFTQNVENILEKQNNICDIISNRLNLDFKLLCLKLNVDEDINFDEGKGYEIHDTSPH